MELHPDSAGRKLLLCRPLHSIVSPDNIVTLDPDYFGFQSCECEVGFTAQREHEGDNLVSMICLEPEVRKISHKTLSSINLYVTTICMCMYALSTICLEL